MQVAAAYYDGRSARRHDVLLTADAGLLRVQGETDSREEPLAALDIPAALGNTPRQILFADGARCEVADQAGFAALLLILGHRPSPVAHMEARWSYAIAALLLTLGVLAAGYVWGLPYAAQQVAKRIPDSALTLMDDQFLNAVDGRLLHPSKLSATRQQALTDRLKALRPMPGAALPSRVLFRSSPEIGPNAFALPGGSVVVLDEIVKLSANDEEILGVLAHEMGHVSERHALRQMLQASVVGLAMAWYVGDISSALAAAPTALLQTRYSRDFERRADAFAARMLVLNGMPASRLADMLQKLGQAHGQNGGSKSHVMDYLSSHPDTDERIRTLRSLH